ncbi:hypothetical protein IM793_22880 [Pedobacter sp. MR2016-19]|uniref:hypothetical protein n=1 Tax=Pedobacter sp. MR2016-19 TaxID=2780089 RepID=UPI0018755310|nr:hypothetical protein [Pedobacter sp. MR2016-19]MBE5322018.1 hypothetical protein [Pedobacter sp. MR2016-19]
MSFDKKIVLNITSEPESRIYINNEFMGLTTCTEHCNAGAQLSIRITKPGFLQYHNNHVAPQNDGELALSLKRDPNFQGNFTAQISLTDNLDTAIYLDGKKFFGRELTFNTSSGTAHRLKISRPGYKSYSAEFKADYLNPIYRYKPEAKKAVNGSIFIAGLLIITVSFLIYKFSQNPKSPAATKSNAASSTDTLDKISLPEVHQKTKISKVAVPNGVAKALPTEEVTENCETQVGNIAVNNSVGEATLHLSIYSPQTKRWGEWLDFQIPTGRLTLQNNDADLLVNTYRYYYETEAGGSYSKASPSLVTKCNGSLNITIY